MTDTDYPEISNIQEDNIQEENQEPENGSSSKRDLPSDCADCNEAEQDRGFDRSGFDAATEEDNPARLNNIELGRKGESAACKFLERKGFEILERNWVCAAGEADIIASLDCEYGSELHFIEVKTRMSTATGFPEEAVTEKKRKRYEQICELYLQQHYCEEARVTFDIISILVTSPDRAFLRMHCNVLSGDCF